MEVGLLLVQLLDMVGFSSSLYKKISDVYASAYAAQLSFEQNIELAVTHITGITKVDAKVDCLKTFLMLKNKTNLNNNRVGLHSATISINRSVLDRNNYTSINDYLQDNNLKVDNNWALLCAETGTQIDAANIV